MNITLPQNPKLRLAINLLTYAVMGWYLLCDLLSLLLRRSNPCRQRHPGRKAAVSSGGLDVSG